MKQEIDNNAMWAAFRQELALQGELQVVAAIDNALNNLGFTIKETSTIIPIPLKQGEQKPVDVRTTGYWHVEDTEQKPAWSEEDEKEVAVLEAYIRSKDWSDKHIDRALGIVDELVKKLKSIKDRVGCKVNCTTTKEWSEEDGAMFNFIALILRNQQSDEDFTTFETTFKDCIDWLKSLKERYTWKPSEVQMDVLLDEANAWTEGCPKQEILESLYNDLKKLRGE